MFLLIIVNEWPKNELTVQKFFSLAEEVKKIKVITWSSRQVRISGGQRVNYSTSNKCVELFFIFWENSLLLKREDHVHGTLEIRMHWNRQGILEVDNWVKLLGKRTLELHPLLNLYSHCAEGVSCITNLALSVTKWNRFYINIGCQKKHNLLDFLMCTK